MGENTNGIRTYRDGCSTPGHLMPNQARKRVISSCVASRHKAKESNAHARGHGLTQEQLAELAGCSVRTIRTAESGGQMDLPTMQRIADALGVEFGFLSRPE